MFKNIKKALMAAGDSLAGTEQWKEKMKDGPIDPRDVLANPDKYKAKKKKTILKKAVGGGSSW